MQVQVKNYTNDYSLVTVKPPNTIAHSNAPYAVSDCIFVVDTSYSMNEAAGDIKELRGSKFNVLDIAKHALQTICHSMSENTRIAVVSFSDTATIECGLTYCTQEGKEHIVNRVMKMKPLYATNLIAGITTAFEVAAQARPNSICNIVILTDGMPSSQFHPARAIPGRFSESYSAFVRKLQSNCPSCPIITSVGLGYNLDTELLGGIGELLHVPDVGDVGPFMVNLAAWISSVVVIEEVGPAINMSLEITSNAVFSIPAVNSTQAYMINVPMNTVIYDVERKFVIQHHEPLKSLRLRLFCGTHLIIEQVDGTFIDRLIPDQELKEEVFRANSVRIMQSIIGASMTQKLQMLQDHLNTGTEIQDTQLYLTMSTEVKDAVLDEATWNKWGRHYFRTFPFMLMNQRRSNFRDQALQKYNLDANGETGRFESASLHGEEMFATLTIVPSLQIQPTSNNGNVTYGTPIGTAVVVPDEFMRGGGCVHENASLVKVQGGIEVLVPAKKIKAHDYVKTPNGIALVLCVGFKKCEGGKAFMSKVNDLLITPWHPVKIDGTWIHPATIDKGQVVECGTVYSFVLASHSTSFFCNGITCASLGHGITEPVVYHEYWGTSEVLDDMKNIPSFKDGFVDMSLLPS